MSGAQKKLLLPFPRSGNKSRRDCNAIRQVSEQPLRQRRRPSSQISIYLLLMTATNWRNDRGRLKKDTARARSTRSHHKKVGLQIQFRKKDCAKKGVGNFWFPQLFRGQRLGERSKIGRSYFCLLYTSPSPRD